VKNRIWIVLAAALLLPLAGARVIADDEGGKPLLETERVVLENARVRVIEYRSKPGGGVCGPGMHSHPAHVTIVMQPARDRVVMGQGKVQEGELQTGDVFWSDGDTHTDTNVGQTYSHLIVVELKDGSRPPSRRSPR
jgi:hypothetical protein